MGQEDALAALGLRSSSAKSLGAAVTKAIADLGIAQDVGAGGAGGAGACAAPACASYQRGMEWADRVLSARPSSALSTGLSTFKSALSTSLESVSALAVPQAVQEQLELQARTLEAHAQLQQSLLLDVREEQARMAEIWGRYGGDI